MIPAISIALLLLSTTVVKSWGSLEDQTEAEGDFSSQFKQHVREGADHHAEKEGNFDPNCEACKDIVTKAQQKLAGNNSKEEIKKQMDASCSTPSILRQLCKKIIKKSKDKLIDGIAKGGSPLDICRKLRYCK
ncbi:antimicrobial peptide NK-lysin-like [Thunnus albacares]|uniref:antimicrobial peptide NK-lysin-like n=1 Tax=Thunnus albacares TaxID=8236 RepID=UPI001CF6580E|nr:antimicrobial peptide NK-lysin-like [Thunnus albacares]